MNTPDRRKRLEELLHAYELGMLDDREREEFELLLMENNGLFEEVRRFEPTSTLLRNSRSVRATIGELAASTGAAPSQPRGAWRRFVPASAVALILLVVLLLKDWQIEFRPSQEAVASEKTLVIPYFENLADPEDSLALGPVVANLLITDFTESSQLRVVSSQHLRESSRPGPQVAGVASGGPAGRGGAPQRRRLGALGQRFADAAIPGALRARCGDIQRPHPGLAAGRGRPR
jgi:hypothetical protein